MNLVSLAKTADRVPKDGLDAARGCVFSVIAMLLFWGVLLYGWILIAARWRGEY